MDHIRNQQANDILEAMERLLSAGYVFTVVTDLGENAKPEERVIVRVAQFDNETIHTGARKATLRDALAHLIQILEV